MATVELPIQVNVQVDPQVVQDVVNQHAERLMRRFNTSLRENLQSAVDELLRLALNSEMEDKDRAKWLAYIIERVVGKVPDKLEVRAADPWETIISDIFAEVPDGAVKEPRYMKDREPDGEHT